MSEHAPNERPADAGRNVRIGDREREQVVELLNRHAAEGRLEPEELEARIDATYAARTREQPEPLTRTCRSLGPSPLAESYMQPPARSSFAGS